MKENSLSTLQKILKNSNAEKDKLLKTYNEALATYERKTRELEQRTLQSIKDETRRLVRSGHILVERGSLLLGVLKQGPKFFRYREEYLDGTAKEFIDEYSIVIRPEFIREAAMSYIANMVVLTPKDVETIKKHWKAAKDKSNLHSDDAIAFSIKALLKSNNLKVSDLKKVLDSMTNED